MAVEPQRFAGSDKKLFPVTKAAGINTQSPRESIGDNQFAWLENLQPIADGNYRALYSNGTALYTASNPLTIVYTFPFNIGSTNYIFVCLSDGTAVAVNSDTAAVTTISSTVGAFYGTNVATLPQCVQSGRQFLVIVSGAGLGYAVWDGKLLYFPGTITPIITITNGGKGYATAPTVQINGGAGSGVIAVAAVSKGIVTVITVTNPGSGYLVNDQPTISLIGGQTSGTGASLTAVLSAIASGSGAVLTPNFTLAIYGPGSTYDRLDSVTVTNGGTGYSALTTASWNPLFTGGYWPGPVPTLTLTIVAGVITAVTVGSPFSPILWNNNGDGRPTINVTDNGSGFFVSSVTGTPTGTNYSPSAVITATGGGSPVYQATVSPVVAAGVITGVNIQNGGKYGTNTPPTLTVTDPNVQATATLSLMPTGMGGTAVEMYQSRVWIANKDVIEFSAPGTNAIFDFNPADGAGAFSSQDSFLRLQFTAIKQLGPFLYLFGDSSINVISNIQSSGSPIITTFNNQNLDPQIGTPWRDSVTTLNGKMFFANTIGVYSLQGNNVTKVSDDLDGIFTAANATLTSATAVTNPSAAFMTLNQMPIYMLVIPVQGPLDVSPRTALVMWDGKANWWVGSQSGTFIQVSTQEVNSIMRAWGNTGTTINKLFNTASGSLTKTWQTKLWSAEGPHIVRQATRLYSMAIDKTSGGYTFTGTYDFRLEGTAIQTQSFSITDTSLTGSGSINANVRGSFVGFTLHTTKDDFVLLGHGLLYQEQSPLP